MPVRSLNSSVLRWPDAKEVDQAVRQWAREMGRQRPEMPRAGYFGSYARGDWGAGSDLDVVILVERAAHPFERRALRWDVTLKMRGRFGKALSGETVWVYEKGRE
jgi:hypothetical protein